MKALSIKQPWAWLIVKGWKTIENRNWPTHFRGEILIHAGKTFDWEGYEWLEINMPDMALKTIGHFGLRECFNSNRIMITKSQLGGIVGKAEIVDCVTAYDSPWFSGPYGFVVRNAQPLPFAPCKGQLGFFKVK